MLKSKTASQLVTNQQGTEAKRRSMADDIQPDHAPKKRGDLAATLDPLLKPRRAPGRPGRPKGVGNYEWNPAADKLLLEMCAKWEPAKAKGVMGLRIQEVRPTEAAPRPDSVRKAVERRMAQLGITTGQTRRKPDMRKPKPWTASQTTALLGALGGDATIESIAARTGHSVKSVRAKLVRLNHTVDEIHGSKVFTTDDLVTRLHVTPRQIRRWRERGWLETKDHRVTAECVKRFLRAHPDRIPFDSLPREKQVSLIDLGFPSPDAAAFKKNVREILDGLGRQRKPRRPVRMDDATDMDVRRGEEDVDDDDASTLTFGTSA